MDATASARIAPALVLAQRVRAWRLREAPSVQLSVGVARPARMPGEVPLTSPRAAASVAGVEMLWTVASSAFWSGSCAVVWAVPALTAPCAAGVWAKAGTARAIAPPSSRALSIILLLSFGNVGGETKRRRGPFRRALPELPRGRIVSRGAGGGRGDDARSQIAAA